VILACFSQVDSPRFVRSTEESPATPHRSGVEREPLQHNEIPSGWDGIVQAETRGDAGLYPQPDNGGGVGPRTFKAQ